MPVVFATFFVVFTVAFVVLCAVFIVLLVVFTLCFAVFIDFLSSPEDINLKFRYSNLLKFIRIIAIIITLFLPGFYVAITNYHTELLPTELLFTIAASRNTVPFPVIFEIFLMEFSFELIREAGLRVPTPIGPTIRNCWCINIAERLQ